MELKLIKVTDIWMDERARKDYGDVREIIESFKAEGVIQPIAVKATPSMEKPYKLLAGGRRLKAASQMGLPEIPCRVYPESTTPIEELNIELAENICRMDLSMIERARLCKRIHDLQTAVHGEKTSTKPEAPGWSRRDTAELLNRSPSSITTDIMIANALEMFPQLESCRTKDEVRKVLSNMQETLIKEELAKRIEEQRAETPLDIRRQELCNRFVVADFFAGSIYIPESSIDIVEVDPPYAIDLPDMRKTDGPPRMEGYNEIASSEYQRFIEATLKECKRVLVDGGWLIFWFGPEPWFEIIYNLIKKYGFEVRRIPGIWVKPQGQTMQPHRYLANNYEMFFYAAKGQALISKQGRSNVFEFPGVSAAKRTHPTERPIELMTEILETFGMPGSRVLVPFLGSGNTLLAASNLGMSGIGYELTQAYKDSFVLRVYESEPGRYKSYG